MSQKVGRYYYVYRHDPQLLIGIRNTTTVFDNPERDRVRLVCSLNQTSACLNHFRSPGLFLMTVSYV